MNYGQKKKTMYARGKSRGSVRTVVWRKNTRGKASWYIRTGKGFRKYSGKKYGTRARAKASWPKKKRKKTVRRVKRRGAARSAAAESRAEVWGRQAKASSKYERTTGPEPADVDFGRRFRRNSRFGAQTYRGGPYAASLLDSNGNRMTLGGAYTGLTNFQTGARLGLDGKATGNTIPENLLSSFWATGRKVPAQGGANAYTTTFGRRRNLRRPMRFF